MYFYTIDHWEFYDVKNDPKELINQYDDPVYQDEIASLKEKLKALQAKYEDPVASVD
jgi:hypothetical protein